MDRRGRRQLMMPVLLLCCMAFTGCYYDKEEELYGATPCDTSQVNYTTTVSGILNTYGCMGCHSGSTPSGNINLQTVAAVQAVAQSGKLFGAVNHSPGFSAMPKGGAKMSNCDINKIKAWIDAGALNN